MPTWLIQIVVAVGLSLLAAALQPRPKAQQPAALQPPTTTAGGSIPKVFGEITITSTNTLWYGDMAVVKRNAK